MMAIKVRRGIVYVTTGVFFALAALAQLQGNSPLDTFMKAGVAAAVLTCGGLVLAHMVDDATRKAARKAAAPASAPARPRTDQRGATTATGENS